MWLARNGRREVNTPGQALTGPVTLPGDPAGAYLGGERRNVAVYAPGGYHWVPRQGDQILVLKAGDAGEELCAVGVPAGAMTLEPGEVLITAGGSAIKLEPGGRIKMTGTLTVNGRPVLLGAAAEEEK